MMSEAERNFSKLSIKGEFNQHYQREDRVVLLLLPIEKANPRLLTCEERIKEYRVQNRGKNYLQGVSGS